MTDVRVRSEIAPGARIDPTAVIGQWCVIGPGVSIGAGTRLADRVTVVGRTTIGRDNSIGNASVLGGEPQDLKYAGGETYLLIGDRNRIGRKVTVNRGTEVGGWVTYIGSDNRLDDACHVAHDCFVYDHTHLGWQVLLAGHIVVQTGAVIKEMTGVHHFARIGRYARVGARTPVRRDVAPYVDYFGEDYYESAPRVRGLHEAGIAAAHLTEAAEAKLREVFRWLFEDESAMAVKLDQLDDRGTLVPEVACVGQFCRESLAGHYGRYREQFRGQIPPEADELLSPELRAEIEAKQRASASA